MSGKNVVVSNTFIVWNSASYKEKFDKAIHVLVRAYKEKFDKAIQALANYDESARNKTLEDAASKCEQRIS